MYMNVCIFVCFMHLWNYICRCILYIYKYFVLVCLYVYVCMNVCMCKCKSGYVYSYLCTCALDICTDVGMPEYIFHECTYICMYYS